MFSDIRRCSVLTLLIWSLVPISVLLAANVPVSAADLAPGDSFPVGPSPVGIAIGPSDIPGLHGLVYVASYKSGKISYCAEVTRDGSCGPFYPSAYFPDSRGISQIAVDDNTRWAYVTNINGNSISVFRSGNYSSQTIPVGRQPLGIAVDSTTHRIYVANSADGTLSVLAGLCENPGDYTCHSPAVSLLNTVKVGRAPISVAVDSATQQVFVTHLLDGTVSVVDATNDHVSTVAVGAGPYGVATDPRAKRAYVTNSQDGTVSIIDEQQQNRVVATIPVGSTPHGIAVDSTTNDVLVANNGNNTVSSFHASVSPVVRSVSVGAFPESVAVDPVTHRVFVTNFGQGTVSEFIDPSAQDIIDVPVRFCALENTAAAGNAKGFVRQHPDMPVQGPIVRNSIQTVAATDLADRLQIANDTIWQPQAHIRLVMAGSPSPFPIPVDPDPSDDVSGGEVNDSNPFHLEPIGADCNEVWNVLHPGTPGIPVVDVLSYWTGSMTLGQTLAPSSDLWYTPRLCAEPRTLTISDITRLFATIEDPDSIDNNHPFGVYNSYGIDTRNAPHALAHELGHALTLGHGYGVDQRGQGLQPAGDGLTPTNPGPRIYDQFCDPNWRTDVSPGTPVSLMNEGSDYRDTLLTPLQIEQAREVAKIYPGSTEIGSPPLKYPVRVVDTLCGNPPCGFPARLAIVRATVWFDASSPTAVLSFSPWLISSMDPATNYFFLIKSSGQDAPACSLSDLHFPTGTSTAYLAAKIVLDNGQTAGIHVWYCQNGGFRPVDVRLSNVTVSNRITQAMRGSSAPVSGVDIKFPARIIRSLKSSPRLEVISQDPRHAKLTFRLSDNSSRKLGSVGNKAHGLVWAWIAVVIGLVVLASALVIGRRYRRE